MLYFLSSLAFLLVFAGLAWVYGLGLQATLGILSDRNDPIRQLLAFTAGAGVLISLLFALAAAGYLEPLPVLTVCLLLLLACLVILHRAVPAWWQAPLQAFPAAWGWSRRHPSGAIMLLLVFSLAFLRAMEPALRWDELAYHLPLASRMADAGSLIIDDTLRYPLGAWNLHLLWSTALMFATEPATHLINAFFAALVAIGIFLLCRHRDGPVAGVVGALMFVYVTRDLLNSAYVDLALSAFVFFAFVALQQWQKEQRGGYLLLSAFLLAMAAGTKYHGLLQLPVFALALMLVNRNLRSWLQIGMVLLLFGSWWYLFNWMVSGDPVHPLGGKVFGFWLWNERDLANQHLDIARYGHHLLTVFLPALLYPLLAKRDHPGDLVLMIVGFGGLAAWYLSSRYDRYLIATAPFLAIMSVMVIVSGARWFRQKMSAGRGAGMLRGIEGAGLKTALFGLLALGLLIVVFRQWHESCFTDACVSRVYEQETVSWPVLQSVPGFHELRLYQYGLENETYLLADDTAGDWFGPYRYQEFHDRLNNPAALREHLQQLGRDSVLLNRSRPNPFFNDLPDSEDLSEHFVVLYEDEHVSLYRLR